MAWEALIGPAMQTMSSSGSKKGGGGGGPAIPPEMQQLMGVEYQNAVAQQPYIMQQLEHNQNMLGYSQNYLAGFNPQPQQQQAGGQPPGWGNIGPGMEPGPGAFVDDPGFASTPNPVTAPEGWTDPGAQFGQTGNTGLQQIGVGASTNPYPIFSSGGDPYGATSSGGTSGYEYPGVDYGIPGGGMSSGSDPYSTRDSMGPGDSQAPPPPPPPNNTMPQSGHTIQPMGLEQMPGYEHVAYMADLPGMDPTALMNINQAYSQGTNQALERMAPGGQTANALTQLDIGRMQGMGDMMYNQDVMRYQQQMDQAQRLAGFSQYVLGGFNPQSVMTPQTGYVNQGANLQMQSDIAGAGAMGGMMNEFGQSIMNMDFGGGGGSNPGAPFGMYDPGGQVYTPGGAWNADPWGGLLQQPAQGAPFPNPNNPNAFYNYG